MNYSGIAISLQTKYLMKKTILTLFIGLLSFYTYGQSNDGTETKEHHHKEKKNEPKSKCPAFFIAVSTGLNNNTGIIGATIDVPVSPHFSVEGGAGIGSWGEKLYVGGKYFLKPCHLGWAFGTGITYSTGLKDFNENMETIDGDTEPVELQLNPQANLLLAAYRYWNLGKGRSRFYIELGYSIPLMGTDRFDQIAGTPIDDNSVHTLNLISPGGLIAAIGFSFGVK